MLNNGVVSRASFVLTAQASITARPFQVNDSRTLQIGSNVYISLVVIRPPLVNNSIIFELLMNGSKNLPYANTVFN